MQTFYLKIADFNLIITFKDKHNSMSLIPSFAPFIREQMDPNESILSTILVDDSYRAFNKGKEVGQFDCGGANHGVYQKEDGGYQFMISDIDKQYCSFTESNSDFSTCTVALIGNRYEQRNYGLNNALMMIFSFASASSHSLLMHASVVQKDGKGVLCLGKSGTGKSTHTGLWLSHIPETELMNDDNPIVRVLNEECYIYGSPWSGKTPCYRDIVAPVAGFIRIEQAPTNQISQLGTVASFASLLPTCSAMKWDKRVYNGVCDTLTSIIATTPCYLLKCKPDKEAAQLAYNTIMG